MFTTTHLWRVSGLARTTVLRRLRLAGIHPLRRVRHGNQVWPEQALEAVRNPPKLGRPKKEKS